MKEKKKGNVHALLVSPLLKTLLRSGGQMDATVMSF